MSNPVAGILGDAIAAEINDAGRTWYATYGALATRTWNSIHSLDPTSGLPQVTGQATLDVILDSVPLKKRLTRPKSDGTPSTQQENYQVFFLLRQKLADTSNASVDPLVLLLQQVTDWFFGDQHFLTIAGSAFQAKCQEAAIEALCVFEYLEDLRTFTGCSSLTFEVMRQ